MRGGYQLFDLGKLVNATTISNSDIIAAMEAAGQDKPLVVDINGYQYNANTQIHFNNQGQATYVYFIIGPSIAFSEEDDTPQIVATIFKLDILNASMDVSEVVIKDIE